MSRTINYRFASLAEGQQLIRENTGYYNQMNQVNAEWRYRKEGATVDDLKQLAQQNVRDFTQREKDLVAKCVDFINQRLEYLDSHLPLPDEIVYVKSELQDEGDCAAYTSSNWIILSASYLEYFTSAEDETLDTITPLIVLLAHELFHCITRHSFRFRAMMYGLIGFKIMDHDIVFPPAVQEQIMCNPDVEHIDNYATFKINGVNRDCAIVTHFTKTWAEACAESDEPGQFFEYSTTHLVPLDAPSTFIDIDDVPYLWVMMGRNTKYITAAEECLADNFSYAVVFGHHKSYPSPQIIHDIHVVININTL